MKKSRILFLISLFIISACGGKGTPSADTSSSSNIDDSSIVTSSEASSARESSESKNESIVSSEEVSSEVVSSSEDASSIESSSEEVEKLNPMNEPYVHQQYYLNHIGDIFNTWKSYTGKGVTIAVIDIGFNPNHEDFFYKDGTSKISNKSASFTSTKDKITKQWTTTKVDGIDAVINMGESHGTFCAGVAAAAVNGKGVTGIAPDASLLSLKTDANPRSIAEAFTYAADQVAKVVTISIGSYYNYDGDLDNDETDLSTVFYTPVQYCLNKGTVVISAGGNGGLDGNQTEWTFPGATTGVIGVGGLKANSSDAVWEGSSYNYNKSSQFCDVFAPANLMYGMCHFNRDGKYYTYDGGWNGTSFASPIVAGIAALYFEKNPNNTPSQFEMDLYNSCTKLKAQYVGDAYLNATQLGNGRVDVGKLLGTDCKDTITIKIKYNGSTLYAFGWDNAGVNAFAGADWPGKKLTKSGNYYSVTVDSSKYQNIIFNGGKNTFQTVDLLTSSFCFNNIYNLTSKQLPIDLTSAYIAPYIAN